MGTTAPMDSRIGRLDGVCRKKSGVAGFTARVALVSRQVGVRQLEPLLHRTIAMLDSQIGWLDGQLPRRRGAAKMLARAALQQQEGALEPALVGRRDLGADVCARHLPALRRLYLTVRFWHRFA